MTYREQLANATENLVKAIGAAEDELVRNLAGGGFDASVWEMKYPDGRFILLDAYTARVNALTALAQSEDAGEKTDGSERAAAIREYWTTGPGSEKWQPPTVMEGEESNIPATSGRYAGVYEDTAAIEVKDRRLKTTDSVPVPTGYNRNALNNLRGSEFYHAMQRAEQLAYSNDPGKVIVHVDPVDTEGHGYTHFRYTIEEVEDRMVDLEVQVMGRPLFVKAESQSEKDRLKKEARGILRVSLGPATPALAETNLTVSGCRVYLTPLHSSGDVVQAIKRISEWMADADTTKRQYVSTGMMAQGNELFIIDPKDELILRGKMSAVKGVLDPILSAQRLTDDEKQKINDILHSIQAKAAGSPQLYHQHEIIDILLGMVKRLDPTAYEVFDRG